MKKKTELVFVPSVGISHLAPTVEFAKHLLARDDSFSITVLIMPSRFTAQTCSFIESSITPGIQFIHLPPSELPPPPPDTEPGIASISLMVETHKPSVKTTLAQLIDTHHSLDGLVLDMFTTTMIDIANEFNIPSYIYFTSGAALLGIWLHLPTLDTEITVEFKEYSGELRFPSFSNPVPPLVLPISLLNKKSQAYAWSIKIPKKFRQAKGIIVNSLSNLEAQAMDSFSNATPKVYPVGPLLNLPTGTGNNNDNNLIIKWLDTQPPLSVIFLCFGSRATFRAEQVTEIAIGLERSGHRFLWSLRQPGKSRFEAPSDYTNLEEILPEGFLERTKGRGFVCGWAPQVEVLAHEATGGFVSHCGWNSTLESLWFGVPILTWPLEAEQKLNAFELVRELGLAVGIKEDYDYDRTMLTAEEIEDGVKRLMNSDDSQVIRKRVKEMSEICRKAVKEGGSSFSSLGCLVHDLTVPAEQV